MKKTVKNPIVSVFVLAALMVSVAAFAFSSPSEEPEVNTIYWFEYDGINIGDYMGDTPDAVCSEPSGSNCALGFSETHVDLSGPEVELESGVTAAQAVDDAFKL